MLESGSVLEALLQRWLQDCESTLILQPSMGRCALPNQPEPQVHGLNPLVQNLGFSVG
jgi:hypothetical protein